MKNNNFRISALTHTTGNRTNITLSLLLKLVGFAVLFGASIILEAQYSFSPSDFTIVSDGFRHQLESPINSHPTYRLVRGSRMFPPVASIMHHNTSLDLSMPFVFSSKVGFFGNWGNEGLTFTLHNVRPYDSLIGMPSCFLGYGWADTNNYYLTTGHFILPRAIPHSFAVEVDVKSQYPYDLVDIPHISFLNNSVMSSSALNSAHISVSLNSWHCFSIVWRYKNNINSDSGFLMQVYWDGSLKMSRHCNSYLDLGLTGAVDSVVWGISSGVGDVSSWDEACETKIQFVGMENSEDIDFSWICDKNQTNN